MGSKILLSAPAFVMTLAGEWRSAKEGTVYATEKGPRLELGGVLYKLSFTSSVDDDGNPVRLSTWVPDRVRRKKGGR